MTSSAVWGSCTKASCGVFPVIKKPWGSPSGCHLAPPHELRDFVCLLASAAQLFNRLCERLIDHNRGSTYLDAFLIIRRSLPVVSVPVVANLGAPGGSGVGSRLGYDGADQSTGIEPREDMVIMLRRPRSTQQAQPIYSKIMHAPPEMFGDLTRCCLQETACSYTGVGHLTRR